MAVQTTYQQFPDAAFPGTWFDARPGDATIGRNNEAPEIPFGTGVVFDNSGGSDVNAKLPGSGSDTVWGIAVHSQAHEIGPDGSVGDLGVRETCSFNIALKGRMNVVCENGCTRGDRLFVRHTVNTNEQLGALRSAVDGGNTLDVQTSGRWLTTVSAGQIAVLEFDFTNL